MRNYLGECFTRSGILSGLHSEALGFLVSECKELCRDGFSVGAWHGDRVIVVGDCSGIPDDYGIKTSCEDDPKRNLSGLAYQEFEDISCYCIGHLIDWHDDYADRFANIVAVNQFEGPILLVNLGDLVLGEYQKKHEFEFYSHDELNVALQKAISPG